MTLFSKTVAERTQAGQRQDVEEIVSSSSSISSRSLSIGQYLMANVELDYVFHVYARTEGLCGVVISGKSINSGLRIRSYLKILDEFLQKYPLSKS